MSAIHFKHAEWNACGQRGQTTSEATQVTCKMCRKSPFFPRERADISDPLRWSTVERSHARIVRAGYAKPRFGARQ